MAVHVSEAHHLITLSSSLNILTPQIFTLLGTREKFSTGSCLKINIVKFGDPTQSNAKYVYTERSISLCAPVFCIVTIRCTETFWSLYTYIYIYIYIYTGCIALYYILTCLKLVLTGSLRSELAETCSCSWIEASCCLYCAINKTCASVKFLLSYINIHRHISVNSYIWYIYIYTETCWILVYDEV